MQSSTVVSEKYRAVLRFVNSEIGNMWYPQILVNCSPFSDHPHYVDINDGFIEAHCPNGFKYPRSAIAMAQFFCEGD